MIKKKINRSKLNTAGRSTVIWALSVMLVCAFTCFIICRYVLNGTRTVSAEGAYKPLRVEIPFECLGDTKLSHSHCSCNHDIGFSGSDLKGKQCIVLRDNSFHGLLLIRIK